MQKRLTLLGSTGSIGDSTLDVVARHPERFSVYALTAHRNGDKLVEQCLRFKPEVAVVGVTDALKGQAAMAFVVLRGAQVLAHYVDGPAAGGAAVTRHVRGDGTGWYMSTHLTGEGLAAVLHRAYADAGLAASELPDDVEVVRRHGADADYLVAVNHTEAAVAVPADGTELLSGEPVAGTVKVPAGGAVVVRTTRVDGSSAA